MLLPNYEAFEEARNFAPGDDPGRLWRIGPVVAGVAICEDLWSGDGPPEAQAAAGRSPSAARTRPTPTARRSRPRRRRRSPAARFPAPNPRDERDREALHEGGADGDGEVHGAAVRRSPPGP